MGFAILAAIAIIGFIAASASSGQKTSPSLPGGPPTPDQDAFDALVASAIAKKDIPALTNLAAQAQARGDLDEARSIRDEIARLTGTPAKATPPGPSVPVTPDKSKPIGRATIKVGSTGADVAAWQAIIGVKQDGIFGPTTDAATRAWQKSHGLVADGIVGPKTWAAAYSTTPALAAPQGPPNLYTSPLGDVIPKPPAALPPAPPIITSPGWQNTPPKTSNIQPVSFPIAPPGSAPFPVTSVAKARPIIKVGSSGQDVIDWQKNIGVTADGKFGPNTQTATINWQKAHGLSPDGIVGPLTWASYGKPATVMPMPVSNAPTTAISAPVPNAPHRTIQFGSNGPDVALWQKYIGVYNDGIFGSGTRTASKAWQSKNGLVADGIIGPKSWAVYDAQNTTVVSGPSRSMPASHDSDVAAAELCNYLATCTPGKENRRKVATLALRMGCNEGYYGRDTALKLMQHGCIPSSPPYYWPRGSIAQTNAMKKEFITLVRKYQAADPQRSAQWAALAAKVK